MENLRLVTKDWVVYQYSRYNADCAVNACIILEAWNRIGSDTIYRLTAPMPDRISAVIICPGYHTTHQKCTYIYKIKQKGKILFRSGLS